jgi:hypothetical protein
LVNGLPEAASAATAFMGSAKAATSRADPSQEVALAMDEVNRCAISRFLDD